MQGGSGMSGQWCEWGRGMHIRVGSIKGPPQVSMLFRGHYRCH
jgi:hypothetical protein